MLHRIGDEIAAIDYFIAKDFRKFEQLNIALFVMK